MKRSTIAATVSVLVLLVSGCTPTAHRLQPYSSDRPAAEALERRAAQYCVQLRSVTPPHPFTTDGCSMWPDDGWVDCCVEHDIAYWCGGTSDDRRRADAALRDCVARDHSATLAWLMYWGVRLGGVPWQPFAWRWGYGWNGIHGYAAAAPRGVPAGDLLGRARGEWQRPTRQLRCSVEFGLSGLDPDCRCRRSKQTSPIDAKVRDIGLGIEPLPKR